MLREVPTAILVMLAFQWLAVGYGFLRTLVPAARWVRHTFTRRQLAGIALVFAFTSATVSPRATTYFTEIGIATFVQIISLLNLILVLRAVPQQMLDSLGSKIDRLLGARAEAGDNRKPGVDPVALGAALFVTVLAVLLNLFSYERHPHVPDEVVYLYHARYFATGLLTLPLPPVPAAFDADLMLFDVNRWFSPVNPGWPAVLAIGSLIGMPWLVNPVLAGICVLLTYSLTRDLYDRETARLAAVLLAASPWHVFLGMSFMTHSLTLAAGLTAAWAANRLRQTGYLRWGIVAGSAMGIVALVRPLEGLAIAVALGLWALGFPGLRLKIKAVTSMAVSSMAVAALVLPYNSHLTGRATYFPIMAYSDVNYGVGTNGLGFGPIRGQGWGGFDAFPGHSALEAVINANMNMFSVNIELFGWAIGSMLLVAILLFSAPRDKRDLSLLAFIGLVVGIHSFYWFSGGPDFGARYWYLIIVPCVILTIRGLRILGNKLGKDAKAPRDIGQRLRLGMLLLTAMALINFFPWRAVDKYHHFRGMRPDIRALATEYDFGRSLVLVRGDVHPDFGSAMIYNPLDLHADVPIYAWDRNDEVRRQLLQVYPDRPVWLVDGPTITQTGFRVVAGPVDGSDIPAPKEPQ